MTIHLQPDHTYVLVVFFTMTYREKRSVFARSTFNFSDNVEYMGNYIFEHGNHAELYGEHEFLVQYYR